MLHHSPDGAQGLFQSMLDVCFLTPAEPLQLTLRLSAFGIDDNINSSHLAAAYAFGMPVQMDSKAAAASQMMKRLNVT